MWVKFEYIFIHVKHKTRIIYREIDLLNPTVEVTFLEEYICALLFSAIGRTTVELVHELF